jgi:Flp pilus assembly protein CpaB
MTPLRRPNLAVLRRRYLRHRRALAAVLAAGAVVATVAAVRPPPAPSTPVVVAAHPLISGTALGAADVRVAQFPTRLVPSGAESDVADVVGRRVAAPMRAGEVFTDQRVIGDSLVAGYGRGAVLTSVQVDDAGMVALLRVGDRVDVYAADRGGMQTARLVASGARVALVQRAADVTQAAATVVVAVDAVTAAEIAQAAAYTRLTISLRSS